MNFADIVSPWQEMADQHQQQMNEWRSQSLTKIYADARDPQKFAGTLRTMGDPLEAAQRTLSMAYLQVQNNGQPIPGGSEGFGLYLDQVDRHRFGGRSQGDVSKFFSEIQKEAIYDGNQRSLFQSIHEDAHLSIVAEREPDPARWQQLVRDSPSYDPEQDAAYLEEWTRARNRSREMVAPFAEPLRQVWQAMQAGGAGTASEVLKTMLEGATASETLQEMRKKDAAAVAAEVYMQIPEGDRRNFMDALGLLARSMPKDQRPGFFANLARQGGRDVDDLARNVESVPRSGEDIVGLGDIIGVGPTRAQLKFEWEAKRKEILARRNFASEVRRIERSDYDPVKSAWGDKPPGILESGLYGIPGVLASSATVLAPYVGPALMYSSMEGAAYDQFREQLLASGADEAYATERAAGWAPYAAVPQAMMERLQAAALMGRLPVLEKTMKGLGDRIASRAARMAIRAGATTVQETGIEMAQDTLPWIMQDVAAALQEDLPAPRWMAGREGAGQGFWTSPGQQVPDVVWLNGKDGALDGFWSKSATVAVSMLPLAIIGAGGGASADARSRAFAQASSVERRALGITPEADAAITAAAAQGQDSLNAAVDAAMATRDASSETAQAAVAEMEEKQRLAREALAQAERAGVFPVMSQDGASGEWSVIDPVSGEVFKAPNHHGALRIAQAKFEQVADLQADSIAYLSSMLQATEAAAELDVSRTIQTRVLDLGTVFTQAMAASTPEAAARYASQIADRERVQGGDGSIAGTVLGISKTSRGDNGERVVINRLFDGADVTTVFHEDFHALRSRALESGLISREEEISVLRALDRVLAGKTVRTPDGNRQIRLLPDGIEDTDITETMRDEAIAELAEVEVLRSRSRSGKSRLGLAPGLVTSNLRAIARLAPEAARKFSAFIEAVRARWGIAMARVHALRKAEKDGSLETDGYEAYLTKLLGQEDQAALDAEALRHAEEILGTGQEGATDAPAFSIAARAQSPILSRNGEPLVVDEITTREGISWHRGRDPEDSKWIVLFANRPETIDNYGERIWRLDTSTLRELPEWVFEFAEREYGYPREILDPADIVDSAEAWDDHQFVSDLYQEIENRNETEILKGFRTRDGAVLFPGSGMAIEVFDPFDIRETHRKDPSYRQVLEEAGEVEAVRRLDDSIAEYASFSLSGSQLAGSIMGDALSRIRNPERRAKVMERIARAAEELRLQAERLEFSHGNKRLAQSLRKQAAMQQALRANELEGAAWARHWGVLSDDDLLRLKAQPAHEFLANPKSRLHGRLMSKSKAIRQHPDLFQLHRAGDYDGSENISRSVFGGSLMPDQAAQEMFEAGLLREPTTDAMWTMLQQENDRVESMKKARAAAMEDLRNVKKQAREEANQWLREQSETQATVYNPAEEIRRSLALLDGLLAALPAHLRGRIGGYTQLARLGSNESRLKWLKERLARVDKELEAWLREQFDIEMQALLKRAQPKRAEAGEKPSGKIGADVHDLFRAVEAAMVQTGQEVEARALLLETWLQDGVQQPDGSFLQLTPEQASHATLEASLIRLAGDWGKADAARRESAVLEATRVFERGYMEHLIETSRRREARAKKKSALFADTKKTGARMERRERAQKDQTSRSGRAGVALRGMFSFGDALQFAFGDGSEEAIRMADWERHASSAKSDAIFRHETSLEDLFTAMAGSRFEGEKLRARLADPNTIRIGKETFSQNEAISATLMWRQEDGRRHMEGHLDDNGKPVGEWHYNEAFMEQLEEALSDEAKAVRLHLQEAYGQEYDRLNTVYRSLYGINLPRHKFYSPLTVKPVTTTTSAIIDPVTGSALSGSGFTPGALRTRSQMAVAEPDFRDALQVYLAHMRQIEHWIAYAPFATEAQALLSTRDLGNAVEAATGEEGLANIRLWLDFFAQGGNRDAAAQLGLNRLLNRVLSRVATSALVGRASVLAIQSTQLLAAASQMPVGAYLTRFGKLMTGQLGWKKALQSEYIQRRKREMPAVVRQAMEGLMAAKPSRLQYWTRRLGETISGADARFTAGTYAINYDYQLSQALARGLSQAEAEAEATETAQRLTDRVAQPTRPGARSLFEATATNPAVRLLWSFASDTRQKLALAAYAAAKRPKREAAQVITTVWLMSGVATTLVRSVMADLRDDEDEEKWFDERNWDPGRLFLSALTGPVQGIPFLGPAAQAAVFAVFDEFLPEGNMLTGLQRSGKTISRDLPKVFSGDGDVETVIRAAETIAGGAAIISPEAAAVSSLLHIVRDLFGYAENATN